MSIDLLNKDTFKQAISDSQNPVIVDFYADWCQPCKRISPLLEEIADENKGKLNVYKVNTDKDPALAMEFNVTGIPNIVSFKDGKLYKRVVGVAPKEDLLDLIQ
ncbi:MAG: thioredoxin [Clostridiales bacterium]|jgi:thioredoxin 1|nr:thioredoxin [Clostridiales bacterium]